MRSKSQSLLSNTINLTMRTHALPISIRQSIIRTPRSYISISVSPSTSIPTRHIRVFRRHASDISPSRIVRPLVPPPREGAGPLLSRRPDRELPNIERTSIWFKTLPIFFVLVGLSSLAIFNYQKSTSSTVNSILYALRTNEHARALLGDEIYFASKIPWIRGELSPLQGVIDITFWVKGTKATAQTKFVSLRKGGKEYFETLEWSLKTENGEEIQLLELEGTRDPISGANIES
ncbi:cytochrome oxidase assembly protein 1 [Elasticomyces elasticus]|uniref:Cytochrome oxidase assembly protein 1 n=1 Tax=Exophiala sideris TaxID=1016849 RepID=A0ABR0JCX2_9EURO|nr:cytochrome oxidase assembly protein 1 [Elasticomyces elasticus]KAK5032093.1 cytochrome oxidase assembly protein 1 [Exophiala sideris]KAK5041020.1 cytochrome oxidase assembly protein 1 [Exophiala sideris]KAK5061646.1 cytochrome oxidase assembly protein 1 [Exophiala sideris]KAK5184345.1 cytochrome oxidase assembly protein 1 [Eurotiomycetes sp. CCFEE 6388]